MSPIPKDAFILLIGAMKSGTSFVFDGLARHPEICGSDPKEPEFFSRRQSHRVKITTLEEYERLWDFDPSRHRYVLDGSTGYTKYPTEDRVPETIAAAGLNPRLIYVVRDPVKRLESEYRFGMGFRWNRNPSHLDAGLLARSNYGLQLSRFIAHFPRESLLVLKFEDVIADPDTAFAGMFEWLGLPPCPPESEPSAPANVTPEISRIEGIIARHATPLGRWLPMKVRRVLRRIGPVETVARLTDEQRAEVRARLTDETRTFGDEYGIDVTSWGF